MADQIAAGGPYWILPVCLDLGHESFAGIVDRTDHSPNPSQLIEGERTVQVHREFAVNKLDDLTPLVITSENLRRVHACCSHRSHEFDDCGRRLTPRLTDGVAAPYDTKRRVAAREYALDLRHRSTIWDARFHRPALRASAIALPRQQQRGHSMRLVSGAILSRRYRLGRVAALHLASAEAAGQPLRHAR
jgi:hypothetical protein